MSPIGAISSASTSRMTAKASASGRRPRRAASVLCGHTGIVPQPPRPRPMSEIDPSAGSRASDTAALTVDE